MFRMLGHGARQAGHELALATRGLEPADLEADALELARH